MNFINNMKIGMRLNLILSITMIVILTTIGLYLVNRQRTKIIADTDIRMFEQVNDLVTLINIQLDLNQNSSGFTTEGMDITRLKGVFSGKKYFDSGYPFMINNKGKMIIHPTKEGENLSSAEFFRQLVGSNANQGKTHYMWEGKQKYQYFRYIEKVESYVSVSIYEHELMGMVNEVRLILLFAILFGVGIFVFINSLISRNISTSLKRAVLLAEEIAKGNLDVNLDIYQKDEVGQLSDALNAMITKLKEIVSNVIEGTQNISKASQETSSTSQQLSQGANEQASSVEEVSSTMEEITSNIQQNTDNSQETDKISRSTVEGVQEVAAGAKESLNSIKEIAQKITIINDIAFQTNILALNAAVEAARAGEHGKGFAVVAAEVRKLAERSKISADEIGILSKSSVAVTEDAGQLMGELLPEIEKTASLIQEITAASLEQSNGAEQVNSAIQQVNSVTQQNAAAAEELAASSEEMASQAEQLTDLIGFFNIGNKSNSTKSFQAKSKATKAIKVVNTQMKKPQPIKTIITNKKDSVNLNMFTDDKADNEFTAF